MTITKASIALFEKKETIAQKCATTRPVSCLFEQMLISLFVVAYKQNKQILLSRVPGMAK